MKNSKGQIFYGMHFYPGVAEYQEPGKEPYRVFLNEDTIRSMDPTFAGRPIFVQHVDGVTSDIDELKSEADGWVVESFFNSSDGKHWVKFIICSEKAERAIKQNWKLSNCYVPKSFAQGGLWNGVSYQKEITAGEYEHLAIVPNPRYEESVIMTPEQFKKYNEEKVIELTRLSNARKEKGIMKFFRKTKVENDISDMCVTLKNGRGVSIAELIAEAEKVKNEDPVLSPAGVAGMKKAFQEEDEDMKDKKEDGFWAGNPASTGKVNEEKDEHKGLADLSHKVKLHDGSYCNVGELVEKHKMLSEKMKDAVDREGTDSPDESGDPSHGDVSMEGKDVMNREGKEQPGGKTPSGVTTNEESEDEKAKKKALELAAHEEKEMKAKNAREAAARLANAHLNSMEVARVDLPQDQVARGKSRYGSK